MHMNFSASVLRKGKKGSLAIFEALFRTSVASHVGQSARFASINQQVLIVIVIPHRHINNRVGIQQRHEIHRWDLQGAVLASGIEPHTGFISNSKVGHLLR